MPVKKNPKREKASSYEVARLAGVSQATVSRVFSPGRGKVASATRQKVLEATRKLNYKPSLIARSLVNNSTRMIAFICGRINVEFFGKSLDSLANRLLAAGYTTLFMPHNAVAGMEETLPLALQYKVDGIIISTTTLSSRLASMCAETGTPVVLFDRYAVNSDVNAVCLDNRQAGRDAANHLIEHGHRRLGFLAGDLNTSTNSDRQRGFIEAAAAAGLTVRVAEAGSYEYPAGYAAAAALLEKGERPDGVFCAGDYLAAGLIDAARQRNGLRVPEDISVIGLTNSLISKLEAYKITTIQEPIDVMAQCAVDVLLNAIENHDDAVSVKLFPGVLVERETVADRRERPRRRG